MTQGNSSPEDDLLAPISFLDRIELWDNVKPYHVQYYTKEDFPRSNIVRTSHDILIKNIRKHIGQASLDTHGFETFHFRTSLSYEDFKNDDKVKGVYCWELENYLKKRLDAKHVRALDYEVRKSDPIFPYLGGKIVPQQPSLLAHVDLTPTAARNMITELFGDSAPAILKSRFQIITLWRPLRLPIKAWPLAVCDARTVDRADLMPSDVVQDGYTTENYLTQFNAGQDWYWLPDFTADEMIAFKAVDTDESMPQSCPHSSFPLPGQDTAKVCRESIDVRLLVLYADETYPEFELWSETDQDM